MLNFDCQMRPWTKPIWSLKSIIVIAVIILTSPLICHADANTVAFKKYLESVTRESPNLRAQQLRYLSEKSSQWTALLGSTPQITLNTEKPMHRWGTEGSATSNLSVQFNLFKSGYDVWQGIGAAQARQKSDLELEVSEIRFQAEIAQFIFAWLEQNRQMESLKTLLESKKELLRVAQFRYRKGLLAEQEVDKVQVEFTNSEVQLRQVEIEFLRTRAQLVAFLGDFGAILNWPWSSAQVQQSRYTPSAQQTKQHKIYELEANYYLNQARSDISVWLPRVDLRSTLHFSEQMPFRSEGDWASYLTASWEIWDGGMALSNRLSHYQLYESALLNLRDYDLRTEAENKIKVELTEKLLSNLKAAQTSASKSQKLVEDSIRRFELGRSTVNDRIIDQTRAFNAELLAQASAKEYHLHLLNLCIGADVLPSECF